MYCSTCGRDVTPGLSYCNHCGARLNQGYRLGKSVDLRPESLIGTIAALFIFGLAAITVLMGVMKTVLDLPVDRILAFSLLPFFVLLLLEGFFIKLLLRHMRGTEESRRELAKQQVTNELNPAHALALPENMPSVTEHTTRVLESISNERK